jgi:DNA mismatch repair ATPase MutL
VRTSVDFFLLFLDALRTELEVKFAPTRNTFAVNSGGFQQPLNSFLTAGAPWPTSPLAFLDKPHSTSTTVTSTAVSSGETVESIPVALSCDENIISSVSVAEDNMVESQGSFTLSQTQSSQDSGISSVKSTSESSPPVVADEKPLPRSRNPSRSSKKERRMLWLERESAPHSTLPPVDGKDWSSDAGMRSNCESGNQDTRKKRQRIVLSDDEDNDSCGGGGVNDTEPPGYTKDEEDEDEDGLTSEIRSYVTHKRRAPWGNSMSSRDTCTKKSQNYSQKINKEDDIKDPSDNNEKDCNKADDIIEDSKANGDMCEEEDDDESTIDNKIGDDNDSEKSIDIGGSEVNDDVIDMEVDEEVEVVEKDEKEKGDECAEKVTASNRSFNGCSSDDDNDDGATLNDESVTWNFDPEKVLDLHKIMTLSRRNDTTFRTRKRGVHFKAADTNSRVLSKGDFAGMRVLGQFNLGFIIAQLDDDLYILDQHACDEKFIFEKLSRETVVHKQV